MGHFSDDAYLAEESTILHADGRVEVTEQTRYCR